MTTDGDPGWSLATYPRVPPYISLNTDAAGHNSDKSAVQSRNLAPGDRPGPLPHRIQPRTAPFGFVTSTCDTRSHIVDLRVHHIGHTWLALCKHSMYRSGVPEATPSLAPCRSCVAELAARRLAAPPGPRYGHWADDQRCHVLSGPRPLCQGVHARQAGPITVECGGPRPAMCEPCLVHLCQGVFPTPPL